MEKLAFIFPGQGSQFVGMGKGFYEEFDVAKQVFEEANDVLGKDLKKICFEGSASELNKTENMLTAILVTSVAAFRSYMKEIGHTPIVMAGHSLGEYSALTCSGAISLTDAIRLIQIRTQLAKEIMQQQDGVMTVVNGVRYEEVAKTCQALSTAEQIAAIACINGHDQLVLSGHQDVVMQVEDQLIDLGATITPLLTAPPFHSPLMEAARPKLEAALSEVKFQSFRWPVLSNVTARPYTGIDQIIPNLSQQLTDTVRWMEAMRYMEEIGVTMAIEMGPQAILSNLVKANSQLRTVSYGQKDDRMAIKTILPKFSAKHAVTLITRILAVTVATKNRNFDAEAYRVGVEEPYEKIESMQEELERDALPPTIDQMKAAMEWLQVILNTKQVPLEEQERRIRQILLETNTAHLFPAYQITHDVMA